MKNLISGACFFVLACFTQAEEAEHVHKISREKTLEFIGAYFGTQLPFSGADLSESDIQNLMKGYVSGVKGEFDPSSMDPFRHEVGHLMGDLVQNAKAKKDALLLSEMSKINIPMTKEISHSDGKKTSLAELAKGSKALFIDFWASWCGPCMANMPKLKTLAPAFQKRGVKVIGMNTEDLATAAKIKTSEGIAFDWVVEPEPRPFSQMLKIDSIPRAVILSPEGQVLFNGHPADTEGIEAALAKAGI